MIRTQLEFHGSVRSDGDAMQSAPFRSTRYEADILTGIHKGIRTGAAFMQCRARSGLDILDKMSGRVTSRRELLQHWR